MNGVKIKRTAKNKRNLAIRKRYLELVALGLPPVAYYAALVAEFGLTRQRAKRIATDRSLDDLTIDERSEYKIESKGCE